MADIDDLMQEFRTSSNGAVGTSFFAMRRSSCLLGILRRCFVSLEAMVCFDIISFFATAVDLAMITIYRDRKSPPIPGVIATSHMTTES